MEISLEKQREFELLFEEFVNSYPYTPKGIKHINSYSQQRESGRRNYQAIVEAKEAEEDITDKVLLQLLPHRETKNNRQQGAWIHTSYLTENNTKKIKKELTFTVAETFVNTISDCLQNTNNLSIICEKLDRSPFTRYYQASFISPILNSLKPASFILINKKSRAIINYFANTNYSDKLIDYPNIKKVAWRLTEDLRSTMQGFDLPAMWEGDLFDMFCHWLVAEKKYNFKQKQTISFNISRNYNLHKNVDFADAKIANSEENKLMYKFDSDCYFSEETFATLYQMDSHDPGCLTHLFERAKFAHTLILKS